jgi:hypothetical protein
MSKANKRKATTIMEDFVLPTGIAVTHLEGFVNPQVGICRKELIGNKGPIEVTVPTARMKEFFPPCEVNGETYDDNEHDGALVWEDFAPDFFNTDTDGLLSRGCLIGRVADVNLRGQDPLAPLFTGSPHSARDFSRYILAMRHSTGMYCFYCIFTVYLLHCSNYYFLLQFYCILLHVCLLSFTVILLHITAS